MLQEDMTQKLGRIRVRLIESLAIDAALPLVLYLLLRQLVADDATALALAGAVPAAHTAILWVLRRRANWIGLFAVLGFAMAVAISALAGGNSLILKLHEQVLTGIAGLVLLASVFADRPLLLPLLQSFAQVDLERLPQSNVTRKIKVATAVLGLALVVNAAAHVALALTLPTAAYLAASRGVTLAVLAGAVAMLYITRGRQNHPSYVEEHEH